MHEKSFKGKNILITGITGFVGAQLGQKLRFLGAEVFGISRDAKGREMFSGNILDYSLVNTLMKDKKITICFHLAAEALVESGQQDPYKTFKVNVEGTLNILENARQNGLERVIIPSTSHVYGKNKLPYYEGYTPKPTRPYETSKACTDLIAQSYATTFNLPVLIPRFVNIYGPNDLNFQRLIPKTIKAVLNNQRPKMWGGGAVRDYLFIDDAIDAYIALLEVDLIDVKENRIFNFGSGNRIAVRDLIEKIIKLSRKKVSIQKIPQERNEEISAQYVAFNKAMKILHWEPKMGLDEGLKRTIIWYRRFLQEEKS